ncbi:uridine kinase, partial [bacterium]|nr:uridine kinase [bacterium]
MGTLTIGITGGSGSGKTTVSRKIIESVGSQNIVYIEQDSYYKDLSHLSIEERAKNNFDHPASMDLDLMLKHIKQLKSG